MRKLDVDILSGHISVQSTNCLMNILYHITLYQYREMQLSFFKQMKNVQWPQKAETVHFKSHGCQYFLLPL